MKNVLITHAVRTPIGKMGGMFKDTDESTLLAHVFSALIQRANLDPNQVDQVIVGNVKQSTYPLNVARHGWLAANLPCHVAGYTLHRACSSGSQSLFDAYQMIVCEEADVIVAGGVENMSMSCYYLRGVRNGFGNRDPQWMDALTEGGPGSTPFKKYGNLPMGLTAENVAEHYKISRLEQDELALLSQNRALKAIDLGLFAEEIVSINGVNVDEYPKNTTLEMLAKLPPVFKKDGTVTAGNSSGRNDGASVLLIMSEKKAKELNITPSLRFVSSATTGVHPAMMGIGPIEAGKKALQQAGLSICDIDIIELNEAFASQAIAVLRGWAQTDEKETYEQLLERTNVNGSGISLGHPLGATGAILTTKIMYEMKRRPQARYGMVAMCIGGGMGFASIFEKCKEDIL